jgi:hypothetical protein
VIITPQLARKIRTLQFIDRLSGSEIARQLSLKASTVNKTLRWATFPDQDHDLRAIPKPHHPGGGSTKGRSLKPSGLSCLDCVHITADRLCGLDFPECRTSRFKEARHCSAFSTAKTKP